MPGKRRRYELGRSPRRSRADWSAGLPCAGPGAVPVFRARALRWRLAETFALVRRPVSRETSRDLRPCSSAVETGRSAQPGRNVEPTSRGPGTPRPRRRVEASCTLPCASSMDKDAVLTAVFLTDRMAALSQQLGSRRLRRRRAFHVKPGSGGSRGSADRRRSALPACRLDARGLTPTAPRMRAGRYRARPRFTWNESAARPQSCASMCGSESCPR